MSYVSKDNLTYYHSKMKTLLAGKSDTSHTHKYAGSSSAGGAANSVANSLTIQLNGTTNATFNGSAAKTVNITPSGIGAATSGHNHNGVYVYDKANVNGATMNDVAGYRNAMGMVSLIAPSSGKASYVNPNSQTGWHHFINMSYIEQSGSNMWQTQIANAAGTTDLWVRSRSGSAISNDTAWKAPWTRILTGSNYTNVTDGRYVKKSGDTMTGTLTGTLSGNATTATTLQTARTINGTSFNGSANITTANWGTTRNIYITDSDVTNTGAAVSVNGSANATLKLPATIKATLSGNASTATTLKTARTINGTSFNGSANITTSNWGTARTITIGNTGKSVNGSANVSWSLDEIGASAYKYTKRISNGDGNTHYVKLFTITASSSYANFNYEFAIAYRGYGISYVTLYGCGGNDKYASAINFTYNGPNTYPESNLKAFHYKDTTNTLSKIEVWMKLNGWDEVLCYSKTLSPRGYTLAWESSFTTQSAYPTDATTTVSCSKGTFYSTHSHDCMTNSEIDALF